MMDAKLSLLVVIGLIATSGSARSDKKANEVIEAAIKAHGGLEAHKKSSAREVSFEGTWITPRLSLKFKSQTSFVLPDKSRESMELTDRNSTVEVIVNGDKLKQIINGQVVELKDQVMKAQYQQNLMIHDITQFYTLLDDKVYSVKSLRDELVNDRDTNAIQVTRIGMKEVTLYFDKETNRLLKFAFKTRSPFDSEKEVLQESFQSDFKEFKGLLLPTTVVIKQDGKEFMKVKVLDVKIPEKPDLKAYKVDE